jgi:hypothetical protein
MRLPNFLIIGAPRSGTTTLYEELGKHPDVFMSPLKEPLFFAVEGHEPFRGPGDDQGIRDLKTYCELFAGAGGEKVIGEASTLYLYSPQAPHRIKHYLPDVKLVALLRNPAERAYSHFLLHRVSVRETLRDFREAINAEDERERRGWSPVWFYRKLGLYSRQLARYQSLFQPEQLRVFLFEDLEQNPEKLITELCHFLGIERRFMCQVPSRRNAGRYPRSMKLHGFLLQRNFISTLLDPFLSGRWGLSFRRKMWELVARRLVHLNLGKPRLTLRPEDRQWLIEYYREDILRTQELLQRDLSHWLSAPSSQSHV